MGQGARAAAFHVLQSPLSIDRCLIAGGDDLGGRPLSKGSRSMIFGEVTLGHYLALSSLLFLIGLAGVLLRRSLLIVMMSLELLLNAANLALVAVGRFQGLPDPQVAVFFVITVAAAEVSLGLAILVAIFRIQKTTAADQLSTLRF